MHFIKSGYERGEGMAWRNKSKPRRTATPLIAESDHCDSRKNDSFASSFSTSASPAPQSSEYQVPENFVAR